MKKIKVFSTVLSLMVSLAATAQTAIVNSSEMADTYRFRGSKESEAVCQLLDGGIYDINVSKGSRSQYSVELAFPSSADVAKGDVMHARITLRTLSAHQETAECAVYFYFQEVAEKSYSKSVMTQLACGSEWTIFDVPFVMKDDISKGGATAALALGSLSQHVQIKDVTVVNHKNSLTVEQLPSTRFTYVGREEDAQWRKDALERIEKLRTAPINIKVTDAKGRPLKNAGVEVQMQQAEFIWGTAVAEQRFAKEDDPAVQIYRKKLLELFNTAVMSNGFKAGSWHRGTPNANTLKSFKWLCDSGIRQRGHNLVWPAWKFNAGTTRQIASMLDKDGFDAFIKGSFYERMAVAKGHVVAWDVVNEPMHEKELFAHLPEDVMVDWFKLAKSLDPDAQLFINDYAMLNGSQSPMNIAEYVKLIKDLVSKGAPIEGIGVQGHVGTLPRAPIQVLSDLDMFKELDIPVQITEFDINTKDEQLQADYLRDFLIAVYSHPVIEGVTMWGFWEADHWKPDAALYRTDWSPKPAAKIWSEYVTGKWHTAYHTTTDKTGLSQSRGHFGTYKVKVNYKGCYLEKDFVLTSEGISLEFAF